MGFSWFQPTHFFPVTGDAQHPDRKCITDTANGGHVDTVIELHITIVLFCQVSHLHYAFSIFCITQLSQKKDLASVVFK